MNSATATPLVLPQDAPPSARAGMKLLQRLRHGALTLQLPDGSVRRFGEHPHAHANDGQAGPVATMRLHNWNVFSAALKSGDIGFAESFIAGDWDSSNLSELLKLFGVNRREVDEIIYGTWSGRLLYRIKHLLKHNSKANSRKNIHAHYDLGNEFYTQWLDSSMNYSSAWFEGNLTAPLTDAQNAKVRRALTGTWQPGSGDRLRLGRPGRSSNSGIRSQRRRRDLEHRAAGVCQHSPGQFRHRHRTWENR